MKTEPKPRPKPCDPEESTDARRARAKYADSALKRTVEMMRRRQRKLFRDLAGDIGLPKETDRSRLIWSGLVRFVNEDLKGQPADLKISSALRAVITLCVHDRAEYESMFGEGWDLERFADVYESGKRRDLTPNQVFAILAAEMQPKLTLVLRWIADPNRMNHESQRTALDFLIEYSRQPAQYNYDPNDDFDDTGNQGFPLFFWKRLRSFKSIVTPIARFIYERLEEYHNSELELSDAVPIVLCKRDGCGRISVFRRMTKDFCSSSCRTLHRQKEKAADHAAYMRSYRAGLMTKPVQTRKRSTRSKMSK